MTAGLERPARRTGFVAQALVVAVGALMLNACGSSARAQPNPCKTFTDEQAATTTGNAVTPAKATGTGKGCYWLPVVQPGTSLLVTIESDDTPAKFADAKANTQKSRTDLTYVAGVGDEAFAYAVHEVAGAESRSGKIRTRILLQGRTVTADQAVEALRSATQAHPS